MRGWPALHADLARVDPEAAARIHPNDAQRIQRALEVYESTGQPITSWQRRTAPPTAVRFLRWALWPGDRAALRRRIEARFAEMLARGWLGEVERLAARPELTGSEPAVRAVGYRQLWEHVRGRSTLADAQAAALHATQQLVRRQLTWIRADAAWQRLDPLDPGSFDAWVRAVEAGLATSGDRSAHHP